MTREVNFSSGVTATGTTYCPITAITQNQLASLISGNVKQLFSLIVAASFYAVANAGATGGVVQPVILGADGNYHPYGTATTITAAGFLFLTSLTSPVLGVGIQITTGVTGGTVYLECDAAIL